MTGHRFGERSTPKGTTNERGLGHEHRRERARLLTAAIGQPCPYAGIDPKCTGLMLAGEPLDLDHGIARVHGGRSNNGYNRIAHAGCNRRAGARLGAAITNSRRRPSGTSRDW